MKSECTELQRKVYSAKVLWILMRNALDRSEECTGSQQKVHQQKVHWMSMKSALDHIVR